MKSSEFDKLIKSKLTVEGFKYRKNHGFSKSTETSTIDIKWVSYNYRELFISWHSTMQFKFYEPIYLNFLKENQNDILRLDSYEFAPLTLGVNDIYPKSQKTFESGEKATWSMIRFETDIDLMIKEIQSFIYDDTFKLFESVESIHDIDRYFNFDVFKTSEKYRGVGMHDYQRRIIIGTFISKLAGNSDVDKLKSDYIDAYRIEYERQKALNEFSDYKTDFPEFQNLKPLQYIYAFWEVIDKYDRDALMSLYSNK